MLGVSTVDSARDCSNFTWCLARGGSVRKPGDRWRIAIDPYERAYHRCHVHGCASPHTTAWWHWCDVALRELPEGQRVALVLTELHGFSQSEIGAVLGVRTDQVKSYVYQARSNLISERDARGADCRVIREELATARGPALLKSRLRRHLRSCPGCRQYATELSRQRDQLGGLLPVIPSLALKRRALEAAFVEAPSAACGSAVTGGSVAAATVELTGGATKALVAKLLTGVALLGVGTGATTLGFSVSGEPAPNLMSRTNPSGFVQVARYSSARSIVAVATPTASPKASGSRAGVLDSQTQPSPMLPPQAPASERAVASAAPRDGSTVRSPVGADNSEVPHGNSGEAIRHGKSEVPHGNSDEPIGHGKSEESHGKAAG